MDRQDQLLEKEDGRFYAIDKFGTGLASIATSERLNKKIVSFGLPSGPALFLHLAHCAYTKIKDLDPISLFDQHPQGIWPDDQRRLFDFFEDFISHVVFSFTALEAFANEVIPKEFKYTFKVEKTGEERTYAKEEIERRINLDEKLGTVLPRVFAVPSPKGLQVWESYKSIKQTRDRIVHLKSIDMRPSDPEDKTIWGTALRMHNQPFCDYAHAMIGHFKPAIASRRYYRKYPYARS
jgi:hypothetical protein